MPRYRETVYYCNTLHPEPCNFKFGQECICNFENAVASLPCLDEYSISSKDYAQFLLDLESEMQTAKAANTEIGKAVNTALGLARQRLMEIVR